MWCVINLTFITGQVTVGKLGNTVTDEQVCRLGFKLAFNCNLSGRLDYHSRFVS